MAGENEMIEVVQKARGTMMLLRGDLRCDTEAYATGYQDASLERALNREMEYCALAINSLNSIARAGSVSGGIEKVGKAVSFIGDILS